MNASRSVSNFVVAALCLGATMCIIPDREIELAGGPENPGAVRILFRPPVMEEMDAICNAEPDYADPTFCPSVRPVRPPGLISAGASRPFCICPSGHDNRAVEAFNVYTEDPDLDGTAPADTLFGVLLLDPEFDVADPTDIVAYGNYLEPCGIGTDRSSTVKEPPRTVPSQAREDVPQRLFRLDDGSGRGTIDLCNDNNGAPVKAGLHDLQFMVTDRPFFRPKILDEEGFPIVIDGEPLLGPQQCGVPDLASGASYAVADYVFECHDAGDETDPLAAECDCASG